MRVSPEAPVREVKKEKSRCRREGEYQSTEQKARVCVPVFTCEYLCVCTDVSMCACAHPAEVAPGPPNSGGKGSRSKAVGYFVCCTGLCFLLLSPSFAYFLPPFAASRFLTPGHGREKQRSLAAVAPPPLGHEAGRPGGFTATRPPKGHFQQPGSFCPGLAKALRRRSVFTLAAVRNAA